MDNQDYVGRHIRNFNQGMLWWYLAALFGIGVGVGAEFWGVAGAVARLVVAFALLIAGAWCYGRFVLAPRRRG